MQLFSFKHVSFLFISILISFQPAYASSLSNQKAFDFTLPYLKGNKTLKLSDIIKIQDYTILIFFNSKCDQCLLTLASLKDLSQTLSRLNISGKIIGINFDTQNLGSVRSFIKGEKILFPILSDQNKQVVSLYECESYSFSYFIIDRIGLIRNYHLDRRNNIEAYIIEHLIDLKQQDNLKHQKNVLHE